jgi:Protein of unknown function (DUF2490)
MKILLLSTIAFLALIFGGPAAQAKTGQFWPEIDTYFGINDNMRFSFVAAKTREDRNTTDAEVGPNFDIYFNRLMKLKRAAGPLLDEAKLRPWMFRVGYRYLPSSSGIAMSRVFIEVTGRVPLKGGLLVSERKRGELNFVQSESYWRYRNRITVERMLAIARYQFAPYARAEFYYDSRYSKFSRTALDVVIVFPLGRRFEIELYYEHQNDTGKSPNRQVNAVGLALSVYFRSQ